MLNGGLQARAANSVLPDIAAMRIRLFLILAAFAGISAASAHTRMAAVDSRVHASEICWDPDVEFPVPCDDDSD